MEHLSFYKETLEKITKITNETSAPFAQILMYGGSLPEKEKKILDELGTISAAIFQILRSNGYEVKETGNVMSVELEGSTFYCAKKAEPANPVVEKTAKPVSDIKKKEETSPVVQANEPSKEAQPEVKPDPVPEMVKEPAPELVAPIAEETPQKEEAASADTANKQEPAENSAPAKQEDIWGAGESDDDFWGSFLNESEEKKEEPVPATFHETVNETKPIQNEPEELKKQEMPEESQAEGEPSNSWDSFFADIESKSEEPSAAETPKAYEEEPVAQKESIPTPSVQSQNNNIPSPDDWWKQIEELEGQKKEEVKPNEAADAVEKVVATTTEKKPENDFYMPGRAKFNFNGTGFADDKEGKKRYFSTPYHGIVYDLYDLKIVPPVETGYKPENLKVMIAPIVLPETPTSNAPLIAVFTFRGKQYAVSSLDKLEKGKNLCQIYIENYCFLVKGSFDDDLNFRSAIFTSGQSIRDKIALETNSKKSYGTNLTPGKETKNGLTFTINEDRIASKCYIYPMSADHMANFVCLTRSLDFLDYHYHTENIHGAQEITFNINQEKTIIRLAYKEDEIIAEAVEVI